MAFTVRIKTDNAAFDSQASGDRGYEVARILRALATRIEAGSNEENLRDINGNAVGKAGFGR